MKLLFVYGTLKRGAGNHHWLADQTFVSDAQTQPGFRLFDLGEYPGLVVWPEDKDGVAGEIWSVDAECLRRLDEFEGIAQGLFRRMPVPLKRPSGAEWAEPVDAYVYPHSVAGRPEIGSVWRG